MIADVLESLSPAQNAVRIVLDELTAPFVQPETKLDAGTEPHS